MTKKITITITNNQAEIILRALANESNEDMVQFGEYSYWRCFVDVAKKMKKEGMDNYYTEQV
jgi:hypothetical protein